ncbi:N-acetylglucosamine kinase [Roseateles depolymerans]|uniref:Putative BadF/BadG/BcrA/BcrD ATPase family protein n=1 Tax=Roseateles depolymerans TaxID=76731 RepID=A0A0U3MPF0_9BURK|nr:BadF/BadG/BcrA/BcrD ATPase family protein [Roseateles depolymerans]ALV04787.1 Putative BadF/BadG/BcrA/BcrD ATPase family protein [Roseateles depolymerans]REG15202.1 N-acetylglucosamine kinase-like BadF-type ATPase [Roseateles depolymerans]
MSLPSSAPPSPDARAATARTEVSPLASRPWLGLGLDAGGTQTRWCLAQADGTCVARGAVGGLTALLLESTAGRITLAQTLQTLAADVRAAAGHGRILGLDAGITGLGEPDGPAGRQLRDLLAQHLGLPPDTLRCDSDIAAAWHALFQPGEGHLVYAGTGAIAAHIDTHGALHRAGGRGPLIGDEGGGLWIAREALALIWRREDEAPGAWQQSLLARRMFERLGGPDWSLSRHFLYGGDAAARRGSLGQLALAVGQAAHEGDTDALALLHRAGVELARLALALCRRLGPLPISAAGRVLTLHPAIATGLRSALPLHLTLTLAQPDTALSAARRAAVSATLRSTRSAPLP